VQRFCFVLELRPGSEAEYERRHNELWPELAKAMTAAGIRNYTLFRRELQVIGYCECEPDGPTAFARVAATDADRRWTESMAGLIARETGADGELISYSEIWHQD
jgi:L-rhamnose mutarotase